MTITTPLVKQEVNDAQRQQKMVVPSTQKLAIKDHFSADTQADR